MPPPPYEGHLARIKARQDYAGHEITKRDEKGNFLERPWLVLSNAELHQQKALSGPAMRSEELETPRQGVGSTGQQSSVVSTKATGRFLVSDGTFTRKNKSYESWVDTQQLWTFPCDWITDTLEAPEPNLGQRTVRAARKSIAEWLNYSEAVRETQWLFQGQVVWLRLPPRQFLHGPDGQPLPIKYTDKVAWSLVVRRLPLERGLSDDQVLPAVILTNDNFLPRVNNRKHLTGFYPLVTVVPLVVSPYLNRRANWNIRDPKESGDPWVPITSYLLTVDYWSKAADGRERVVTDLPGYEGWKVSDDARRRILDHVADQLGL